MSYNNGSLCLNLFFCSERTQNPRKNTESHKQPKTNQISKFDHSILSAREDLNTYVEIHPQLPKHIMRHLENFLRNKQITCLGYDKEVFFNNLDYSKPIKF